MNDTKKVILSIFGCTFLTLGSLTLLYLVYGKYIQSQCSSRIDELMTNKYAVKLGDINSGLTVELATPSMSLQPEPTATATATPTPTRRLIRIPPSLTPPPAQ